MFDPHMLFTALVTCAAVLTAATIALSRVIPDRYDRRVAIRKRSEPPRRRK